ncbi:hypothetical protein M409DRAFT_20809 [Zasmidium cellare ATCC 36951]|uniref:MARVEL domain-containing protein n=1 Tax=Zasmidium cellare ATCC 36951 TaxID=1080233 RepID=A0A6A6CQ35_ZASCE|nr:uncharacterized protein M409DRAFT_20809 [Zasmidium cellare ATCC 36951]KAF2168793.1 hypothetical protein M409DRAFT_20809 [Zasmidium cellare ATCC 36951]
MEKVLRRRASVPEDFGTTTLELDTLDQNTTRISYIELDRRAIRRAVMSRSDDRRLAIIRVLRVFHIIIGPILIGLAASLLRQYRVLRSSCDGDFESPDCEVYQKAVGAFRYCVFPGIWSIVQGSVGLWATYSQIKLLNTMIIIDSMAAGFHMGAGCTLAAMLNGWSCEKGLDSGERLCDQFYTAVAFFFIGVVASYGIMPLWCQCKVLRRVRESTDG